MMYVVVHVKGENTFLDDCCCCRSASVTLLSDRNAILTSLLPRVCSLRRVQTLRWDVLHTHMRAHPHKNNPLSWSYPAVAAVAARFAGDYIAS